MLEVPASSMVDGHVLQVPVSDATATILKEVFEEFGEEIQRACARRGLNIFYTLVPEWKRIVTVEEIRTLTYGHEQ